MSDKKITEVVEPFKPITPTSTVNDLFALPEAEQARRGKLLAEFFGMKKNRQGRYGLPGNDKTELGLYRTMLRFIADGE